MNDSQISKDTCVRVRIIRIFPKKQEQQILSLKRKIAKKQP